MHGCTNHVPVNKPAVGALRQQVLAQVALVRLQCQAQAPDCLQARPSSEAPQSTAPSPKCSATFSAFLATAQKAAVSARRLSAGYKLWGQVTPIVTRATPAMASSVSVTMNSAALPRPLVSAVMSASRTAPQTPLAPVLLGVI